MCANLGSWAEVSISAAFVEIPRRHDLDRNRLHPVTFVKRDRKTPYEGETFLPNFCDQKADFDPDGRTDFRDGLVDRKGMLLAPAHDAIAVAASVLSARDLWMDPMFLNALDQGGGLHTNTDMDWRGFLRRGRGRVIAPSMYCNGVWFLVAGACSRRQLPLIQC